jgi:lipopolysaccharide export system protein LptC
MNDRASSLFPLFMLLLLAALTFWLSRVIQGEAPRGPLRHDPDYWAEGVELRRFDINGKLQHTLVAEKLLHYPDDDTTIVTGRMSPIIASRRSKSPPAWPTSAATATKSIWSMRSRWSATGPRTDVPPTVLETRTLKIFPEEEKGRTDDPVVLTRGASVVRGTGLEIDNGTGITVLRGRVSGTLHSNRTRTP